MNDSNTQDREALLHMAREFETGFNSGDLNRLMQFYGDHYVDINLRIPVQSHAERREYYAAIIRRNEFRVAVHPDDIIFLGDHAIVRGRIEISPVCEPGNVTELRYMECSRRTPDGWKALWGMDGPVQEYRPS
jgi:ketosteroid isomerase-like protein